MTQLGEKWRKPRTSRRTTNASQPSESEVERLSAQAKRLLEPLKDIGTIILGFAGIFYVIGFVVTSTYLLSYGISDFSLFKARYIATGVIFLLLTALSVFPLYFVWAYFLKLTYSGIVRFKKELKTLWSQLVSVVKRAHSTRPTSKSPLPEVIETASEIVETGSEMNRLIRTNIEHAYEGATKAILVFITFGIVVAVVLTLLTRPGILSEQAQDMGTMWNLMQETGRNAANWFLACAVLAFIVFVMRVVPSNVQFLHIPRPFWALLGVLLVVLVMIPTYTQRIYPQIPPTLGGGKPIPVQLVADGESASALGELIPTQPTSTGGSVKSQPVDLLDENDYAYFLLVDDSTNDLAHAVRVNKGLVKGIIYLQQTPLLKPRL